jgi:AcrR family transcriptional regulator
MPEEDRAIGLRERKKIETRQALASAAVRLAREHGLEHITVEGIAAAAGVSARTFFNYFASKEDAVLQPDPDPVAEAKKIVAAITGAPAELSPVRALAQALRPSAERLDREAEDWLARISIIEQDPALMAKMFTAKEESSRLIVAAIAARTGLDPAMDFYPQLVFQVVGSALHASCQRWHSLAGKASVVELYTSAVNQIEQGLPVPVSGPVKGEK